MISPFLAAGEAAIVNWAGAVSGVSAVLLTGSRARPDGTADALSDLDLLVLLTRLPAELVETLPVIEGTVLISRQPYGSDEYDLAVVGADFSRLDITLLRTATTTTVREAVAPVAATKHLWRGYRVLVDRMRSPAAQRVSICSRETWRRRVLKPTAFPPT